MHSSANDARPVDVRHRSRLDPNVQRILESTIHELYVSPTPSYKAMTLKDVHALVTYRIHSQLGDPSGHPHPMPPAASTVARYVKVILRDKDSHCHCADRDAARDRKCAKRCSDATCARCGMDRRHDEIADRSGDRS